MVKANSIVFLNWVTLSKKFIYQIKYYSDISSSVYCITNDSLGDSSETVSSCCRENIILVKLAGGLLKKITQTFFALWNASGKTSIAIIAPAGRLSLLYLIFAKLLRYKLIVVEWGSIGDLYKMDLLTRLNMKLCYVLCDVIWYKEPYMLSLLESYKSNENLFFIPNAISLPVGAVYSDIRDIDFIWANRIVERRYPELMIRAMSYLKKKGIISKSLMIGFLPKTKDPFQRKRQRDVADLASGIIRCINYTNPEKYFKRARFFVLIADQIFGNNALLEAMSFGVVPIVNNSNGIEIWLQNGINSIIFEINKDSVEKVFEYAITINNAEWRRLSNNTIKSASTCSTIESWRIKSDEMISFVCDAR